METKKELTSTAINSAGFIEYSDGSIVSKQIIKKDTGTITLFAFDKGQSLSEHTAPFDAFVEIVDGKAECIIDGKPVAVSKGEFIILPANIPHAVNAIEKFKMLIIMIKNKPQN
ncbi:MAG: cupin domain-containing protein [Ignavibacteriales bacterium]|nr:MAG: cupin domain-containing protein [Ignavibacteriales bacterium]